MGIFILGTGPNNSECCGCAGRINPCDGPEFPLLLHREAGNGLSKCGFEEFSSPSDPPKYYLVKSLSGAHFEERFLYDNTCSSCTGGANYYYTDSCTYGSLTGPVCVATSNIEVLQSELDTDCTSIISSATYYVNCDPFALLPAQFTETSTQTQRTISGSGACVQNNFGTYEKWTGSVYENLSSEYTTQMLSDNVTSILPAFTGAFISTSEPVAGYYLSDDEVSINKTKEQYKFELPSLTGYACYRLTWAELYTPDSGSPVYTSFTYDWNGTDTETPVYEIDVPTYPGEVTVVSVAGTCVCP